MKTWLAILTSLLFGCSGQVQIKDSPKIQPKVEPIKIPVDDKPVKVIVEQPKKKTPCDQTNLLRPGLSTQNIKNILGASPDSTFLESFLLKQIWGWRYACEGKSFLLVSFKKEFSISNLEFSWRLVAWDVM